MSRGAFAAYLCRGLAAYGFEPGDRVAHLVAFGSGFSLCELGLAFACGAAVCPLDASRDTVPPDSRIRPFFIPSSKFSGTLA